MMFCGKYNYALDPKNRVSIPSEYRRALADRVVLCYDESGSKRVGCVQCMTYEDWVVYSKRFSSIEFYDEKLMGVKRVLFSSVKEAEIDKQGRIVIPQDFIEYAGIVSGEVLFVGIGERFEIWDLTRFKAYCDGVEENYDDRLEKLNEHNTQITVAQKVASDAAFAALDDMRKSL